MLNFNVIRSFLMFERSKKKRYIAIGNNKKTGKIIRFLTTKEITHIARLLLRIVTESFTTEQETQN